MFNFLRKRLIRRTDLKLFLTTRSSICMRKTTESIEALFKALKQSKVWVPFNAYLMDESEGQEGVRLKPDILQKEMIISIPVSQTSKRFQKNTMIAFLGCNCLSQIVCLQLKAEGDFH